jgi:hypothetical protein
MKNAPSKLLLRSNSTYTTQAESSRRVAENGATNEAQRNSSVLRIEPHSQDQTKRLYRLQASAATLPKRIRSRKPVAWRWSATTTDPPNPSSALAPNDTTVVLSLWVAPGCLCLCLSLPTFSFPSTFSSAPRDETRNPRQNLLRKPEITEMWKHFVAASPICAPQCRIL